MITCILCEKQVRGRDYFEYFVRGGEICKICRKKLRTQKQTCNNAARAYFLEQSETRTMLREKIREYEESIQFEKNLIRNHLRLSRIYKKDADFIHCLVESAYDRIDKSKSKISRIRFLLIPPEKRAERKSFDLDLIKQVPIDQILLTEPRYCSQRSNSYLCPLHNENSASFHWYKEENSFYCFGCQSGGDNIALFMKLNKCDFITACNHLTQLI